MIYSAWRFLMILILPLAGWGQAVRDLYIDELPEILNDSLRKAYVLRQVIDLEINQVTFFKYFSHHQLTGFKTFEEELRTLGVKQISAGFPISYFGKEAREQTEMLSDLPVNSLTFENDFWLKEQAQDAYRLLNQLERQAQGQGYFLQIYFGWFGQGVDKNAMALRICQTFDRILIHHYRPEADFNYLQGRLETFGKAAMRYGRKQQVVVRIGIDPSYFGDFDQEKLNAFYNSLIRDLKNAQKTNKALRFIEIEGWQLYNSRFL